MCGGWIGLYGEVIREGRSQGNPVSEGYRKQLIVLRYLLEEGATEVDQEGEEQEGD